MSYRAKKWIARAAFSVVLLAAIYATVVAKAEPDGLMMAIVLGGFLWAVGEIYNVFLKPEKPVVPAVELQTDFDGTMVGTSAWQHLVPFNPEVLTAALLSVHDTQYGSAWIIHKNGEVIEASREKNAWLLRRGINNVHLNMRPYRLSKNPDVEPPTDSFLNSMRGKLDGEPLDTETTRSILICFANQSPGPSDIVWQQIKR